MDYFDKLKQSLEDAVAYKNGDTTKAKKRIVRSVIVPTYEPKDIVRVRTQLYLSQCSFANMLGVSARTVEAQEVGRNVPNNTARNLLYLIEKDNTLINKLIDND